MILAFLVVLAAPADSAPRAPEYRGADGRIHLVLPHVDTTITVDGSLDEAVWQQAARLTGFSQYAPVDGRPAEQETEVLIWYSASAIYVGIRAHAVPGSVRATLADRDKLSEEDQIQLFFDTYNDGRQAMVFGVNPLGQQSDGSLVEGSRGGGGMGVGGGGGMGGGGGGGRGHTDLSPDYVYQSKGRITEEGFEVEIRIPFKSMRYQAVDPQSWRFNVIRRIGATGVEDSWAPAQRARPSFLGQSGTLEGLTQLHRGLVMDVNPFVTGRAVGSIPEEGGWATDQAVEAGANLRWGMTPSLTLNGTYNPDFSQVESDASQVVYDPRQSLYFPEKRPFFLEGIEQFATPNNLVYTRRIVAPVGAAKLTGKAVGMNVGALLAFDDHSQSVDSSGHPFFAIVRAQRDLGTQSRIGAVYTGRLDGGYTNHVGGVDARVVRGAWVLNAQAAASATRDSGAAVTAPLWQLGLNRTGRQFGLDLGFDGISDQFETAAGFISRSGIVRVRANPSFTFYGNRGTQLQRTTIGVNAAGVWEYQHFVSGERWQDRMFHLVGNFTLRSGWTLGVRAMVEAFGYDEGLYADYAVERRENGAVVDTIPYQPLPDIPTRGFSFTTESPRLGPVSFRVSVIGAKDVNFYEWSPANVWFVNSSVQFRPTSQLRADATFIMQSYQRRSDQSLVQVSYIPRLRIEYQATRSIFLRVVGEYNSATQDSLRDDSRTNDPILIRDPADGVYKRELAVWSQSNLVRAEFLFSYQPVPGTVFFLGYGGGFEEPDRFRFNGLQRTDDSFFLKASYLFRL